jgi:ankyrin repeat protein
MAPKASNNIEHSTVKADSGTSAVSSSVDTRLGEAVGSNDLAALRLLLKKGANPNWNFRSASMEVPVLLLAIMDGSDEIVIALLDAGANPNGFVDLGDKETMSALVIAISRGRPQIVKELLKRGAVVDSKDKDGRTPLMAATLHGSIESVRVLIASRANVNHESEQGLTVLMVCSDPTVGDALIKHGAQVNRESKDGNTALLIAASNGHLEMVRLFLAAKADVNYQGNKGATALMVCEKPSIIKELIKHGAKVDLEGINGYTAFLLAAKSGWTDAAKELLQSGANPHARNREGQNAAELAFENSHDELGRYLIKYLREHPKKAPKAKSAV